MIIDIINEAWLLDCDTNNILYSEDIIGTTYSGSTCFKVRFDTNINLDTITINHSEDTLNVSSYYIGKDLPKEPAFVFPYPCPSVPTLNSYNEVSFYNYDDVVIASGIVCSGIYVDGSSAIQSDLFNIVSDSYTILFNFKPDDDLSGGVSIDNLFFYLDGSSGDVLALGFYTRSSKYFLTVSFRDGSGYDTYDTGLELFLNQDQAISIRLSKGSKLRVGVNDKFVEVDKGVRFLGSVVRLYLGGKQSVGFCSGLISDGAWWLTYISNDVVAYYLNDPAYILMVDLPQPTITTTSGIIGLNFGTHAYPYEVYTTITSSGSYSITNISASTYDDVVVYCSGIDELFCGTLVRGLSDTVFDIDITNNSNDSVVGYMYAFDNNNYKALSLSSDGENFTSNQLWIPTDISWNMGEYFEGPNTDVVATTVYNTYLYDSNSIVLFDVHRRLYFVLKYNEFYYVDTVSDKTVELATPTFITSTISRTSCAACLSRDGKYLYCVYTSGLYKYDITRDAWITLESFTGASYVSVSEYGGYVCYAIYKDGNSTVNLYDTGTLSSTVLDTISARILVAIFEHVYVYSGKCIFKYTIDGYSLVSVSSLLLKDVSSVFSFQVVDGFLVYVASSGCYVVKEYNDGWTKDALLISESNTWAYLTTFDTSIHVVFVESTFKSAVIETTHTIDETVNVYRNYLNKVSLKEYSDVRYDAGFGVIDITYETPNFTIMSKASLSCDEIYGFSRSVEGSATFSIFQTYNTSTGLYNTKAQINNSFIDAVGGVLVESYDVIYYLNFKQFHFYKYNKITDSWDDLGTPSIGSSIKDIYVSDAAIIGDRVYFTTNSLTKDNNTNLTSRSAYSIFGYYDTVSGTFTVETALPHVYPTGYDGITQLGTGNYNATDATAIIDYDTYSEFTFIAYCSSVSKAKYELIDLTEVITTTSGYMFDSLSDLYDYGCRVYSTGEPYLYYNLMMINTCYASYDGFVDTDIPNLRGGQYDWYWDQSAIQESTKYTFTMRVLFTDTNYSLIITDRKYDSHNTSVRDGVEIGFDNSYFFIAVRTSSYYEVQASVSSLGIETNKWYDFAYTYDSGDGSTSGKVVAYLDGVEILSLTTTTNCTYSATRLARQSFYYRVKNSSQYNVGPKGYFTEICLFNKVLSLSEINSFRYSVTGNRVARLWPIYKTLASSYIPQPSIVINSTTYHYGLRGKRLIKLPENKYLYVVAENGIVKYDYILHTWETNVLHNDRENSKSIGVVSSAYTFYDNTLGLSSYIEASNLPVRSVYIEDVSINTTSKVYNEGVYVTPILDSDSDSMFTYNINAETPSTSSIQVFMRYADSRPIDYIHICYIHGATYYERSLATGKVFYTTAVSMNKSCAVYYDNDIYLVSYDGNVYTNGEYTLAAYTFYVPDFTLENIESTWISPFGNFIVYELTQDRLASFPLGLGYPCAVATVTFSDVYDITWDKFADNFAVRSENGVSVFNYKLGLINNYTSYTYLFFMSLGDLYLNNLGGFVLSINDGEQLLSCTVSNIYFNGKIKHRLSDDRLYYITSLNSELCSVVFSVDGGTLIPTITNYGIYAVSEMIDVNESYIFIRCGNLLKVVTHNGTTVGSYEYVDMDSYGIIYHMYQANARIDYYTLDYIFNNDLVWFTTLPWIDLGTKNAGIVRGNKYVQFKVVLKSDKYNTATPLLNSIYVGSPVMVGPIGAKETKKFYISLDLPTTDSSDVFATKIITYFETLVFADV